MPKAEFTDNRIARSDASPSFLSAVGKIRVTGKNNKTNICSGTLIALTPDIDSRIVISASHCFGNIGGENTIEFKTRSGAIKREFVLVSDYGDQDVALIKLDIPVKYQDIQPILLPEPDNDFSFGLDYYLMDSLSVFYVGGYSCDAELGRRCNVLTYEAFASELLTEYLEEEYDYPYPLTNTVLDYSVYQERLETNITSFGGASGGPAILHTDTRYDEFEDFEEPNLAHAYLVGILRGGFPSVSYSSSNGVEGGPFTNISLLHRILVSLRDEVAEYQ